MQRRRVLDEMKRRKLCQDESDGLQLITTGRVLVNGAVVTGEARLVAPGDSVHVLDPAPRFVSRGGEKLDAALDRFEIVVEGFRAIDVGSSTGGFTDCLLQRGATHVVALDVGVNQLHERLRRDERVSVMEQTNVRAVSPADSGLGRFDLVTADLSFISLRTVAAHLVDFADERAGQLVTLVKPQFEATRREASQGKGVIVSPDIWRRTLVEALSAIESAGAATMGVMVSPLKGTTGNVEFLAHMHRGAKGGRIDDLVDAAMTDAVEEGH